MMQTNQILLSFAFVKLIFYGEDRHVFLLFIKKTTSLKILFSQLQKQTWYINTNTLLTSVVVKKCKTI